ncbi:MAG: G-D-S-L family lipolytic protein [Aquaticitalea sp.]
MKINNIWLLAILLIGFTSCESEDDTLADPLVQDPVTAGPSPVYTSGTADFSTFVAIGNSLTAGYSDGSLFVRGQEASFPNILSQRFALAGGGEFTQPLMDDNVGGFLLNGNPVINPTTGANSFPPRLIFNTSTQSPVPVTGSSTTEITNINPGPYNNMGVPGAKSFHLLAPGYGNIANFPNANPYFIRMASTPNATVLEDALALNPTFFSLWIGNNDVLGYATTGGDGTNPITDTATFNGAMGSIVSQLAAGNRKGIISNIPNVTDAPYFTTVPFAPLSPANPDFAPQIPVLNATFAPLNQAFAFLGMPERQIIFSETAASPVVIFDETLPNISVQLNAVLQGGGVDPLTAGLLANQFAQSRQATSADLLVLPVSSVIATVNTEYYTQLVTAGVPAATAGQLSVNGVTYPLRDKWVVLPSEQTEIANATATFNQTISSLATQYDLALFDVNTFFNGVATSGFQSGSAFLTAAYVTGGTFSLDGVHPSPRGYAVITNQMIGIINAKYGSNLPTVDAVDYTGLYIN